MTIDREYIQAGLLNSIEELEVPETQDDEEFVEQRIFMKEKIRHH